jgi:hypothetical protein
MRRFLKTAGCGLIFSFAVMLPNLAHAQAVPDAPAPQPAAPAPSAPQPTPPATPLPPLTKPGDPQPSFPFPGQDNGNGAAPDASAGGKPAPTGPDLAKPPQKPADTPTAKDFPFPDAAADDASDSSKPSETENLPNGMPASPPSNPNISSSSSLHDEGSYGMEMPANPKRVKEDIKVARYYWNLKDWAGAYLRYKDALRFGPQNPDTLFGLAEAEAMMGKNINARKHYQEYLNVAPDGPHAQDVIRAISKLPQKDAAVKPGMMGPVVP